MVTSGTAIRFIDLECRGPCVISCEASERILNVYAMNPGGAFVFEDENRATFRPQRAGASTKVNVACIPR